MRTPQYYIYLKVKNSKAYPETLGGKYMCEHFVMWRTAEHGETKTLIE